ncbi:MAG: helix-turn-helix domain-containing protein [Bryobacteraceae bacterium]|jgi:predicted DNA-binding transcriptional regulator AlpA
MSEQALLDEKQLASTLNISVASVRRWRLLHQGPRFLKISASVRYRPEDVDAWLSSRPVGGEVMNKQDAERRRGVR